MVLPPTPVSKFASISKKWQTAKCSKLELKFHAIIPAIIQSMSIFTKPDQQIEVIPDRKFFFRSICYWLTGDIDMKEHQKVCSAVVSFMREKWHQQRKRIVGKNYQSLFGKV